MATIAKIANPTNPWRVQIRRAGQATISQCFPTNVEAKRWARAEETKLDKNPAANAGGKLTMAELVAIYTKKFVPSERHPKTGEILNKVHELRNLSKALGRYRLHELNERIFSDYAQALLAKTYRGEPLKGRTVQIKLNYISLVLRYAGHIAGAKAVSDVALAGLSACKHELQTQHRLTINKRDRRPTEAELLKLEEYFTVRKVFSSPFARTNQTRRFPMWDLVLFAMATCMRRGEITKIKWEDFDPIDRTIWIMDRKDPSGAHRRNDLVPLLKGTFEWHGVPMDPIAIMNRQKSSNTRLGRIFPFNRFWISVLFKRACDACGIEDLHFHDLRHEGVSRLFEDKRPMEEVSVVSGHRSWTDLKRYTNLKPKNLHRDTVTP